jgi:type IV pilus assembly protein PilW
MTTRFPSLARVRQSGVTLTELMIALVLGALVVLAATAMVVTSRGTYRTQDEGTRLSESSRFALSLVNRVVRLAGYTNFGDDPSSIPPSYRQADYTAWVAAPDAYAFNGPQIVGANNSKPGGAASLNNSDALTIRFYGTSVPETPTNATGGTADGNVLDCSGNAVPQPANNEVAYSSARDYNVLFVDADTDGEPALKCTRQIYDATTGNPLLATDTQTLIRGVEDFQVLYAEVIAQPPPNQDLDINPPLAIVYRTGIGGGNPVSNWQNVIGVKVAMLLRSEVGARADPEPATTVYHLFGNLYPAGSSDPGTDFSLASVGVADRTRMRRVVQTTIDLRNHIIVYQSLQQ